MITPNPFFLPKITDYWDYGAIERWAAILDHLDTKALDDSQKHLRQAVIEHTKVLSDRDLQLAAVAMSDDLYKSANTIDIWYDAVGSYLRSTAKVFYLALSLRGYVVHYAIDNTFEEMSRPLKLFPDWYSACGVSYYCPQRLLMESRGMSPAGARQECARALRDSSGLFHYVLLDIDSEDDSFLVPLEQQGQNNVITILRNDAPLPGSQVSASLPDQS